MMTSLTFERYSSFLSSRLASKLAFASSARAALTVELFLTKWVNNFEHYLLSALLLGDATDLSNKSSNIALSSPMWKLVVVISGANECERIETAKRVTRGVLSFLFRIRSVSLRSYRKIPPLTKASDDASGRVILSSKR